MEKEELIQYFDENLFIPKLKSKTKDGVLEEIVNRFIEVKLLKNREIVLEMLRQRESLGSTGIGKGIAIPHGRTTAAPELMIAFGKSEDGIEYDSMDGKPVHLIFMILAPPQDENNIYLPLLGKMVEILNRAKNRKKLMAVETFQDFIDFLEKG